MHSLKRSIFFFGLLTFALSCTKNSDVFTEYFPIENLYQAFGSQENTAALELDKTTTIYNDDGLKIVVAAGSLADASGSIPTGPASMTYRHLHSVGDYMKNNLNTQSQGLVMDVSSMLLINFEQEGERLQPTEASNESVRVFVPAYETTKPNNLYEWSDNGWRLLRSTLDLVDFDTEINGQSTTTKGYVLEAPRSIWLAIGQPIMNSDSESMLTVQLPENHNSVNSVVYATIRGNKSLLSFEYDSEKALFYASVGGISTNSEIEVFSITAQGQQDRYDFSTTSFQLMAGSQIDLKPGPKSLEDIKSYINSL